ncbi:unnamed protein product [Cladocopium goreaui]|uniref:Endonuclease/exonuclease/phosphatase domain-containing protein n=1 Tax=Cladocopium goreaui TaxID=2562237 RepID=A0A9P1DU33_9DINO|nr:unnamed protein product [Cladocopium goreaui]
MQTTRNIDIVGCYQHVFTRDKACLQHREQFWMALDSLLTQLPARNTLALLGDLNCSLQAATGICGNARYRWQGKTIPGTTHPDSNRFLTVLKKHGIVALNTWNSSTGPTFVSTGGTSRIDYFCTRKQFADGKAKDTQCLWDAPFQPLAQAGHAVLIGHVAMYWIPPTSQLTGLTPHQKLQGRIAKMTNSTAWQNYVATVAPDLFANNLRRMKFQELLQEATKADLVAALKLIPTGKAVAAPCAPGPTWNSTADLIAVMGLLIQMASRQADMEFRKWPIWAFLAHRSTQDPLAKVAWHCHTNDFVFQHYSLLRPADVLITAADSLLQSVAQRQLIMQTSDIARNVNWHHLLALRQMIDTAQATLLTLRAETALSGEAIQLGPPSCVGTSTGMTHHPAPADTSIALRGSKLLSEADLALLRQQPWGDRVLKLIADDTLDRLANEHEACRYLSRCCFLCGQQVHRAQDAHLHFKTEHAEFWTHVPQKSIVLTNLHSTDTPCAQCGSPFRTHKCLVWTQISIMMLHGGGLVISDRDLQPDLAQRCDICLEMFPDAAQLTQHLQTKHRLAGLTFNAARDCLDSQAACAHCGSPHASMESLRSHICQGRCPMFNPMAASETRPITQAMIDICLHGQLLQQLRAPMTRLHLTLRCLHCSQAYKRACDLANHLMSNHSRLWRQAQGLTLLMVELVFARHGCMCNPQINQIRNNHICLPLRQIAMAFCRMEPATFMPVQITEQALTHIAHPSIPRDKRFILTQIFANRDFPALWTNPEALDMLRNACVICGQTHHTGLLNRHLHEAHLTGHQFIDFYCTTLLPLMQAQLSNDFQCDLCLQIFNLPPPDPAQPVDNSRLELVQTHLRGNCPGDSVMNGWDESALAQIRETYQFLTPLLDKSLKLQPNPKPQKSRRMDTTTQGDPADQDQQGQGPQQLLKYLQVLGQLTLRHEHNWNLLQSTDCFILFFQQDQESALHGLLTATQEWHQQRQSNPMGMTTTLRQHLCQHLLQDLLNRTTKVSKSKPGEVLFQACRDRNLILEDMSWPFLRWDPTKKSLAVDKKKAVTMPKMLEHLQELIEEFRDPTLVVRFQGLSTSHAQATQPPLRPDEGADTFVSLASGGHFPEGALDATERLSKAGSTTSSPAWQEQRDGEISDQGQEDTGELTPEKIHELRMLVSHMTLRNDTNWCYANTTMYGLLWTLLSLNTCEVFSWGPHFKPLMQFILDSKDTSLMLTHYPWFVQLLETWGFTQAQQDCSEFVRAAILWLDSPDIDLKWERRFELAETAQCHDQSHTCMPVFLQFPPSTHTMDACKIDDLIRFWHQANGMRAAMLQAAPIVCLHIDRMIESAPGQIEKCSCAVDLDTEAMIPFFLARDTKCETVNYIPVAAASHQGADQAGHYQALLKIQPTVLSAHPVKWLLTQDNMPPLACWDIPPGFRENLTVIWLIRADCIQIPFYVPRANQNSPPADLATQILTLLGQTGPLLPSDETAPSSTKQ